VRIVIASSQSAACDWAHRDRRGPRGGRLIGQRVARAAQSIYFKDPNGLSLEYCCMVGNRPENAAMIEGKFTLPRATLELNNTLSATRVATAQSAHGERKA
jgi:hypothetical protein